MALKQNGGAHLSSDIDFIATPKAPADVLSTGKNPGVPLTNASRRTNLFSRYQKRSAPRRRPRIRTMVQHLPRRRSLRRSSMAIMETRRWSQTGDFPRRLHHRPCINRHLDSHVQTEPANQRQSPSSWPTDRVLPHLQNGPASRAIHRPP
ncbi:hypothetical protein LB505_006797 [Fusarium chuoi]|nr:hypothetical protein LB505_006797 [Fusarium chuoi]